MMRNALNSRRSRTSCSLIALATVLAVGATPAAAQSFDGSGTFFTNGAGSANINNSVANTTTVTLNGGQTIIDWVPNDNSVSPGTPITFQPAGTTALFTSTQDFAVLNRINQTDITRAITMNGTVNARVGGVQRGSVYFYSPGGFIFGGGSVFSVGSLVVTASPITLTGNNFINGADNTVVFGQAPNSNAAIVNNGTINASMAPVGVLPPGGSYVAMVAPRVIHHGSITVNGSAALVAAEEATINFSPDGLFDIQMTVGTDDPNGVHVTGDIGGVASTGVDDKQRIFLATVPKNDAVTMLVTNGAQLGFDIAGAADIDGNAIVLSAGHNIANGVADMFTDVGSGADANINIQNSDFTSAVFGTATGFADVSAAGDISEFASDLTLRAVDQSFISSSGTGGLLDIAGNLDVSLDVFGEQDGQSVTAGHGALYADGDGAITVDGNVSMTANGFGANSTTAGVHAGNGTGGFVQVQGQGSGGSVTIAGNLFMQADGFGGDPGIAGINAGNGTGGSIYIGTFGNGSSLDVVGTVAAFADGFGGDGNGTSLECFGCNGLGGMGLGGTVQVRTDTATGSTASFGGLVTLSARGEGGESGSAGNPSALGDGGFIGIGSAGGGTLTFTTDVSADAGGMGGDSHIPGIAAGNGIGDTITISADAGSTLLFQGSLLAVANGDGGVVNTGVNGGNGTGGVINVIANGLDGKVTFEKGANLFADGNASDLVGDCLSCGALGGDGFGGSVLFSGTSGGLIETPGTLALSAAGWGGTGVTGAAGNGTGGGVLVSASTGVTINVAGNLQADASGNGGFNIGGFAAGNGTGGTAGIQANGGHVTVTGNVQFGASGFGGNSQGGDGGNGTGGLAGILTTGATASLLVGGNVLLEASGSGGSSFNDGPLGDGGDGFGGRTRAVAEDGSTQTGDIENPSIHVLGNLVLDATATGGTGANGGNAVGRTTPPNNEGADPAAFIFATLATAELQVDGLTNIDVSATGGEGFDGIGGNATAGEIDVASQQGDVLLSDFIGNAEAHGGAGSFGGGAGGNATGGNIDVAWSILAGAPLTGTISADTVALSVNGYGGAGGDGTDANTGGDAGAGGSGTGGNVLLAGNAAGGTLNVGATTILADGYGGIGGSGGNGDTGSGGNGAAGGTGTGGFIQAGTISSESHPGSGGTTTFTTLNVSASASGGAGGDGGIGGGGTGSGGHGGDAVGGEADFFVRGIAVTADSVNLFANATGGNGGAGSPAGNGGDALAGFISVESKDRVGSPLQRGSLTADSIAGTAIAQGGSGNVDGTSTVRGGSYFRVLNGDATIGSLSFVFAGDQYDGSLGPNYIQAQDGTATLGTFSYDTTGELAIYTTSTGSLDVGNMFLVAGNFIDHPTLPGPASPGTIFADNLSVTSGGDFFADANIDVLNGIDITVPGSIQFNQALSPSFIDLWAQGGSITLDGIDTDGTLNLLAAGPINTDAILAGLTVDIHSQTGSVDIGNLDAGGDVSLIAGTFIAGQDVTTGGNIFAQTASGDIGLQNLSGHDVVLDSGNAIDVIGQIDASGNVTLTADSSIALTGALSALGNANLDAGTGIGLGGAVDVGGNALMTAGADIDYVTLLAGGSVNAAAGGGIAGGSIGAGGDIGLGAGNAIALTGNVAATGNIDLTAGTLITGLDFTAGGSIDMDAGAGSITVDNLVGGSFVHLDAGADINLAGVVDAGADVFMTAGLDIAYVTIDAGDSVNAAAGGGLAGGSIGSGGDVGLGAGDAIALTGNVTAAGSIGLTAGTGITGLDFTAGGSIGMVTDAGSINVDNLVGGSFVQLDAGADILVETINSGGFIEAISGADILLSGDIQADGDIDLNAAGHIDMNNGISGESLELDAGGAVLALNLTGGDSVEIDAVGSVTTGNISAGLVNPSSSPDADYFAVIRAGGAIATGNIDAAQNIGLATPGTITTANIDAGGIFMALGHGNMLFGDATASEVFLADFAALVFGGGGGGGGLANCVGTCGTLGADGVVTAPPSGSFYSYLTTEGGVDGAGQLPGAGTAEGATNGSLYTTAFSAAAGDDLNFWFNYVTSDGSGFADYAWAALLTASLDPVATLFTARTQPSGTIVPGQGLPGVEATLNPASVPIIDGAPVWSPLGTSSGTCFDVGCGFTGWIGSTYEIANAGSYVLRFGVSNWTDTAYQSGMAFSGITIGGVPVATAAARTGGSITIGNVDTGMFTAAAGTTLTTGYINSGSSIDLGAGGAISTDNLFAGTYVLAEGGSITTGNIHAGSIDLTSTAGGIATQALLADGDIELDAFGNISFANADAGDEFDFSAGGSVTGGAVVAGNEISGDAGGSVTLGNLTAGLSDEDDFSIGIAAIGNITVGNADGPGAVGFATQGNLQTGNLSGGGLVMALVGGDTTINGSIATTGEGGGQVYMADDSMFITGGGTLDGEGDFDPAIVLALDPVATGGSITINGPVTTGLFEAAAGTSLTTQAITASDIHARAGGLATLNGVWNVSNQANLSSNDIDITATGGIDGGSTGEIALFSSNPTQMQIGDGLSGTGYALSNAEFGRISGADVTIIGRGDASAAIDMLIGDLTVTGSQAGSTIESADGVLAFAVGDIDTETASGVIRVAGDVNATGFGADNAIEFYASRFELDAATGSISIFSSGSTLGGEIGLYADRIHVASATILDQLAANPTYSGYQQDLNEAATVQRPEGVLRASSLWIESDNLQDILIQNTGTAATPAGFLVNEAFVNDDNEVAGPAGSINLIVNGQVVTEGGTLTGIEARDALIGEDTNITPFTANSTINGCPLTGACIILPPPPPPPPPTANVVDNQIDLITSNPLGDSEFGNEEDIDDNEEGDEGANNPISPPQPLFDTRPLIPSSDVNDPVSGTGNPALLGSDQCDENDDETQCGTEKEGDQ